MRPWQFTIASTTRHPMFPNEATRVRAVRALYRVFGGTLALFCVVDDHVHIVVYCEESRCWILARSFKLCMAAISAVETKPVHIEPIHGRNHMENLHGYVLRQSERHGLPGHPALWSGSCFADIVKARWIPGLRLRIPDVLPRYRPEHSCRKLELSLGDLAPVSLESVRLAGAKSLISAAAAACAAAPSLTGNHKETVLARRTACTLARAAGIPTGEIAWALDIHPASVRKLRRTMPPGEALRATRVRLALEQAARIALEQKQLRIEMEKRGSHRKR